MLELQLLADFFFIFEMKKCQDKNLKFSKKFASTISNDKRTFKKSAFHSTDSTFSSCFSSDFGYFSTQGRVKTSANWLLKLIHYFTTPTRPNPQNSSSHNERNVRKKFISLLWIVKRRSCCFGLFISSFVMITC